MRKWGIMAIGGFLTAVFLLTTLASAQQFRVGFVHLQKVMMTSTRAKAEQKRLLSMQQRERAKLEKMKEEFVKLQEDLQKQGPMLKEDTKNNMIKQIGIKEMELKLAAKQAEGALQNAQREFQEVFLRDMSKVIGKIRKEKQLAMVFNSAALISADDAFDITDSVIKAYDAASSAKPAPPAAKKAPARNSRRPSAPARSQKGGKK